MGAAILHAEVSRGSIGVTANTGVGVNAGVSGGIGINIDSVERSDESSSDFDEDMIVVPELTESPLVSATKTTGWSVQPAGTVGASAGVGVVGGSVGVDVGVGISASAGY